MTETEWEPMVGRVDWNCPEVNRAWEEYDRGVDTLKSRNLKAWEDWEDEHRKGCEVCQNHFKDLQRQHMQNERQAEMQRAEEACFDKEQALSNW